MSVYISPLKPLCVVRKCIVRNLFQKGMEDVTLSPSDDEPLVYQSGDEYPDPPTVS